MDYIGNYALHAAIWDWGGYDRTEEFERWCNTAAKYGSHILIPFCAIGETGAYMAQKGFNVTAFDSTPEMIDEGKKRFRAAEHLKLCVGDVRDFHFDIPQVDFCFISGDFGHIHEIKDIKKSLACIHNHLREGGCLVIEENLPAKESSYTPPKTFYPKKQVYPDKKVWKIGDGRAETETGRFYISQTVYIEDISGHVEQFDHSFYLQNYSREEWLSALYECGFEMKHCVAENGRLKVEAIKKRTYPVLETIESVGYYMDGGNENVETAR